MAEFKKTKIAIHDETEDPEHSTKGIEISESDGSNQPIVREFTLPEVSEASKGNYELNKKKYGPLASTDLDVKAKGVKDGRFSLNPLLRDPLSVAQEERRVIEEKVRLRVELMAEEVKARALKEGYDEGVKKGFEESFRKVHSEGATSLKKFEEMIAEAEKAKVEIFRANERFLIEMVFRIAKMVLLRELTTDKDFILRLATELIDRVGVRDHIKLKISQADADTIGNLKGGLEQVFGKMTNLNVEVSPKVQQGGCQLETEWNAIDATLETQLQGIYEALFGKAVNHEASGGSPA